VTFLLKVKRGVLDRLSDAGSRIRKKTEPRKSSSRNFISESGPIIDADFVEVDEDVFLSLNPSSETNSESIDSELLEKLKDYLKTRSQEEISEIFEEIRRILENRDSASKFNRIRGNESPYNEKLNIKEISKAAFEIFSKTASCGKKQIIKVSKVASSKASSIASEGKESIKISSKKFNKRWSDLSPRDRKIISELIVAMIEIGVLKGAGRSKKAAFAILSSIYRHQTPGKKDMEDFAEGLQKVLKRRH
jgi:mRNA-degrading endonuclease RelE of RelBE toxin-antitoxin system